MRIPTFPRAAALARSFSPVLAALLLAPAPARAIIVQAGPDPDADRRLEQDSHQAAAAFKAVAAIRLRFDRNQVHYAGTGVFIGASRDGRKGLLLTSAGIFGYDPDRPRPLGCLGIEVVFGPDPAVAEGRLEVPAERVLIRPGYTRSHHGLLRAPERMRDPEPSTKDDLAILEFDLSAHGAELEAAGIAPAALPGQEVERKAAATGPVALQGQLVDLEEAALRPVAPDSRAQSREAGSAPLLGLGGEQKDSAAWPKAAEPLLETKGAGIGLKPGAPDGGLPTALEATFLGYGAYGTTRAMLFPGNTRVHQVATLVTRGDFLGSQVFMNFAPPSPEAVEEIETWGEDFDLLCRFRLQATPGEARLSAATGPQRLQTHPDQAIMEPGDRGGPLLLKGPDGLPRLAGIGSRALYQPIAMRAGEAWRDSWALISFWEPVEVHLPWIERMRSGLTDGGTVVLKAGKGRSQAAEAADDKEDTTCSLCSVM